MSDGETTCQTCDGTGMVTHEKRRGLELHDSVIPCPACEPDDFADESEHADRRYNGERDPDVFGERYVASYRERLVAAFGQGWLDDLEAA